MLLQSPPSMRLLSSKLCLLVVCLLLLSVDARYGASRLFRVPSHSMRTVAELRGSTDPLPSPSADGSGPSTPVGSAVPVPVHAVDPLASVAAARALIGRYYPRQVQRFNLTIVGKSSPTAPDFFTLSSDPSSAAVAIAGTSGVMLTAGFNYYLSQVCHVQLLTWSSSTPPPLPSSLPAVPSGSVTITSPYLLRYNYNICTLSYSTQWWNFSQWEREIDWMALRGINAPLALNGEDIVWLDTFIELGLNETEVLTFLAGPAFLAW